MPSGYIPTDIEYPDFAERCHREATRDVVFLFQWRRVVLVAYPHTVDGEYGHDGNGVIKGDTDRTGLWEPREDEEYLTNEQLLKMEANEGPCAVEIWQTDFVTLSREEATAYGERRDYEYPDGWRVYGIPADGALAGLLKGT